MRSKKSRSFWSATLRSMPFYGVCDTCGHCGEGVFSRLRFSCVECHEFQLLSQFRCVTVCAVYDETTGCRLTTGASIGDTCAERNALWKLTGDDMTCPKIVVVCRSREGRKKRTFNHSKPCQQCIVSMALYNVQRVCYSSRDSFVWETVSDMKTDYRTLSNVILQL